MINKVVECTLCNSHDDIYFESTTESDLLVRIGCSCKRSQQGYRDFNRTKFLSFREASENWKEIQQIKVDGNSDVSF
jgi:hypothetical protein